VDILSNPGKILASGWNRALAHADGDIILRVDAHSRIPMNFIRTNVQGILNGEDVVGGMRKTLLPDEPWQQLLCHAEHSRFGSGAADYRNPGEARYVDTLAHAAYRRSVFARVGGYDERLKRTEDNDIHYRMKKAGFRFFYSPEIVSFHCARSSLGALLRQKYGNGFWIGLTIGIQPRCFGMRHFVPALFVVALGAACLAGLRSHWMPLLLLSCIYGFSACLFAAKEMAGSPLKIKLLCSILPMVFFLMHVSYGIGTVLGLAGMPFFAWKNHGYEIPWIDQ